MNGKRMAVMLSLFLLVIGLIDISSRLFWSDDASEKVSQGTEQSTAKKSGSAVILSTEEIEKLLAWSDVKPKAQPVVAAEVKPVVTTPAPVTPPPAPSKRSIRAAAKRAIAGDDSKSLIGDHVMTLKGLFYDGEDFAVVEVENIHTKQKQHYRARAKELLAGHELALIGKTHIVIKNGQRNVQLRMFDKPI